MQVILSKPLSLFIHNYPARNKLLDKPKCKPRVVDEEDWSHIIGVLSRKEFRNFHDAILLNLNIL